MKNIPKARSQQIFLRCLILALGLAASRTKANESSATITNGPVLGRLGSDEIGIWARTSEASSFIVLYGSDPANLDRVSKPVPTNAGRDNTGWAHLTGLNPGTKYYYRVALNGESEPDVRLSGSFRTLPSADFTRDPDSNPQGLFNFSFEFGCGNSNSLRYDIPTFKVMLKHLKDEISFAIQNGDWIYETGRDFTVDGWVEQLNLSGDALPTVVKIAPSIVGVWENYKIYHERGTGTIGPWHSNIPSFFTFDDHEIIGDVNGAGSVGLVAPKPVFRDIAVQAWEDYLGWSNPNPHRQEIHFGEARFEENSNILTDPAGGFDSIDLDAIATLMVHWGGQLAGDKTILDALEPNPNAGVYAVDERIDDTHLRIRPAARADGTASYSIGKLFYFKMAVGNCEFFFLDTRSHRQLHNIHDPFNPDISLLGGRQKAWLEKEMEESEADFLFVVSSINLMFPHSILPSEFATAEKPNKNESWTAFAVEREKMITFWDSLGKPVFVLTGDLHNSAAIKITDRVWEFASGPHTSTNHEAQSEGNRPPNGMFDSMGRPCDIRWSTYLRNDTPKALRRFPVYCVVQVNNVFANPAPDGSNRWVAFPRPQVIFQYYSGLDGDLLYAESIAGGSMH